MRYSILLIAIILSCNILAQTENDTLAFVENPKPTIFRDGERLNMKKASFFIQQNAEANSHWINAKSKYYLSSGLETVGVLIVGYMLFRFGVYKDLMNWTVIGVGIGSYMLSYPIMNGYKKQAKRAVSIYNNEILSTSSTTYQIQFGVNNSGIGLSLLF